MSHFTSIKIKINENDHLGTLLAEYGGDFEIKVWILDKNDAWTGELSSAEAHEFISNFDVTKEVFLEELQRALTTSDQTVLYSIDKHEEKGYVFSWKKCLDTGITMKNGEMTFEKVSRKDVYDEVIERSIDHNSQLQSRIDKLQKETEDLFKQKEKVLTCLNKAVIEKENFEKNVYSQFLSVLNAKKERIAELQESVDQLTSSQTQGSPSKGIKSSPVKKEPTQEQPKRRPRIAQDKKKDAATQEESKLRPRNTQEKKEEVKAEEVDPFEVDTDVEDDDIPDVPTPRPSKRESTDVQSQSFSFDSFDEVSSPVAALPKRSKANPKEEVKRTLRPSREEPTRSEKVQTEEELLDEL